MQARAGARLLIVTAGLSSALALAWWLLSPDSSAPSPDAGEAQQPSQASAVSGHIFDEDGQPVANAQVCAWPSIVRNLSYLDELPSCTTSATDGSYRLQPPWPGPATINAGAPSFSPGSWTERVGEQHLEDVHFHPGEIKEDVDLVLKRGGSALRGHVRDVYGEPIAGAVVSGSRVAGAHPRHVVTSQADGSFELWLAPGKAAVEVHADGHVMRISSFTSPGTDAEIAMLPGSTISGVVVDADSGLPLDGAEVHVHATLGLFSADSVRGWSDANGHFELSGLPPGSYRLSALDDTHGIETALRTSLGFAQSRDVGELELPATHVVRGRVEIGASREPCRRGWVWVGSEDGHGASFIDDRGQVELRGLPSGEYRVRLSCEGFVARDDYDKLSVGEHDVEGLVWPVDAGLAISGQVVDHADTPLPGVVLRASPSDENLSPVRTRETSAPSDERGHFELRGLSPGIYALTPDAGADRSATTPTRAVLERDSLTGLRVEVEPEQPPPAPEPPKKPAHINGRVLDSRAEPAADALIFALPRDRGPVNWGDLYHGFEQAPATSGADGHFTVSGLRRGDYGLRVFCRGGSIAVLDSVTANAKDVVLECDRFERFDEFGELEN
ncbi:carboxypeptidase regulatory-like domain-containing protein [Pseudenhygromyxa sp. WMMC2535]|uniref:carboxypeptidase regulatory-like domain-containing protein n=1 Tax=Pseudenhygromyxa sp. WMMC2535 TaxID=2712867 RepID=UPI001555A6E3|nr:carboxypeptidase regulatory-like domain-containing protein [Pseudenhygromyxa sp. WMMC2535]NVB39665.1 carboxypeptidase regulatory-like domain-containing protein [Pseudenhygromyxa sp. WMMC2535]